MVKITFRVHKDDRPLLTNITQNFKIKKKKENYKKITVNSLIINNTLNISQHDQNICKSVEVMALWMKFDIFFALALGTKPIPIHPIALRSINY